MKLVPESMVCPGAVIEPEAVEDRNDWGMAGRTSRNPHPTLAANAMTTNNATTDMANG